MGQYGADWLAGKSIAKAMNILPSAPTTENIQHPAAVVADPARRAAYLNI